jgi:hypothetical protein
LGRRKRRQELITKTAGEEKMGREWKPTSTTTTTTTTTTTMTTTQETSNFCKYHSTF